MKEDRENGVLRIDETNADIVNALNLEVYNSAHVLLDERWKYENVCDMFSRLYFVKSGKGYLKYDGKQVELMGGAVYLVPAGTVFSYGCTELEKLFFHVSLTAIGGVDLLSAVKGIYALPFSAAEFEELFRCHDSGEYTDLLKIKTILYETVLNFIEKFSSEKLIVKRYSDIVEKTVHCIQRDVRINLSAAEISKKIFVSESKIRKVFKNETGMSLGKFIDEQVFIKAKQLLAKQQLSIGEISQRLGFCDQFYFSRKFKEKFNQTPSEFRRKIMIL